MKMNPNQWVYLGRIGLNGAPVWANWRLVQEGVFTPYKKKRKEAKCSSHHSRKPR